VTEEKLENIATVAEQYLTEHNINLDWQIDIISIMIDKRNKTVQMGHLENITLT